MIDRDNIIVNCTKEHKAAQSTILSSAHSFTHCKEYMENRGSIATVTIDK